MYHNQYNYWNRLYKNITTIEIFITVIILFLSKKRKKERYINNIDNEISYTSIVNPNIHEVNSSCDELDFIIVENHNL